MRDKGGLVVMREHAYDTEDLLQGYLADHPDLLAGDQINDVEPRRWLLISREMGLPSEEGGGDRWSADHLFLDQDAIPTIVEVKRSTDTRARREVVAQMLDYAANGVMYWPLDRLRSTFEANCEARGGDPEATLLESLNLGIDTEEFWQKAITNLQAGKVRLIFVADKIPAELRRIEEFLNEQMNPAERSQGNLIPISASAVRLDRYHGFLPGLAVRSELEVTMEFMARYFLKRRTEG